MVRVGNQAEDKVLATRAINLSGRKVREDSAVVKAPTRVKAAAVAAGMDRVVDRAAVAIKTGDVDPKEKSSLPQR